MDVHSARQLDRAAWQQRASQLRPETRLFIDGELVDPKHHGRFESVNPTTGEVLAEVARATAEDVDDAVAAARRAFKSGAWSKLAPRKRMKVLYQFAELLEEHADELALLDALDMGKPISNLLRGDIPGSALTVRFFAEAIDKYHGDVTNTSPSAFHYTLREPLGVVGCIVPWNYPLMMAAWKVAPALAAGNCVVLKPAEQSPLSALVMARLFAEAGGPAGVLNVVNGLGEEAGKALALHMDVDKVAFTGSVEVGKLMMVYAGQSNMKRVSLECGGKSPQIVMADVEDLDTAVKYAVQGLYHNQGEVCNAGSRLLVDAGIHDKFVEKFTHLTQQEFTPGDPLDPDTTLGPLVSHEQQQRVLGYVESGRREGACLAFGGDVPASHTAGYYVEPTLFTSVEPRMKIAREEIFGPVGAVMPFKSLEEAVSVANDSIYGLAASVWTRDLNTAHRAARDIESGVVWVNCFDHSDMTQPWGGYKQSGFGRDKCFATLLEYTQTKSVWVHLGRPS